MARCRGMARAPRQKKEVLGGCVKMLLGLDRVPVLRRKCFFDENENTEVGIEPGSSRTEIKLRSDNYLYNHGRVELTKHDNYLSTSASFPSYVVRTNGYKMLKMEEPPRSPFCAPCGWRRTVVHTATVRGGRSWAR